MQDEAAIQDQLIAALPRLRFYARSLTTNAHEADDLVQETILRAWSHLDRFESGTNLLAWLFTIQRNTFYNQRYKKRYEVEDVGGIFASLVPVPPSQGAGLDFQDLQTALAKLSPKLREIIILVGAEGLSYEEVSYICGVPVGTVKSRVSRARERLAQLLSIRDVDEIGPDQVTRAALQVAA
jgi:RNA polymerase sigma-70 factor (ECF subfamily)